MNTPQSAPDLLENLQYAQALRQTLAFEGSDFTDMPLDHGGPTRYGITLATLRRLEPTAEREAVQNLTLQRATEIYRMLYWQPLRQVYGGSNGLISRAMFDASVLCGLPRATMFAQVALNLRPDGIAGPNTRYAMNVVLPNTFVFDYASAMLDYLIRLCDKQPSQRVFLRGWAARCVSYLKGVGAQ